MAVPGLSTLEMQLLYGIETTAGTQPATFSELSRINAISGISVDVETIDASAISDKTTRTVAGRGDTGGNFTVTVNLTSETVEEWNTLISAYKTAKASGLSTWFAVYHPDIQMDFSGTDKHVAWAIIAEPPREIPMPEIGQNELLTVEITLTINEYKGLIDASAIV